MKISNTPNIKNNDGTLLFEKAIDSSNLKARYEHNQKYGSNNFDDWVDTILSKIHFSGVLDVCCGTGNQLIKFASMKKVNNIVGVDISKNALEIARDRLDKTTTNKNILLKNVFMEKMFNDNEIKKAKVDLISCFYGLYYTKDVTNTIHQMLNFLPQNGTLLIVGPWGNNNECFFNLLQKHFDLPELVLRSSCSFMQKEVLPLLRDKTIVKSDFFVNTISYEDHDSLINYWRSSTFYSPKHEAAISHDIKSFFTQNTHFLIEKHVVAYTATIK